MVNCPKCGSGNTAIIKTNIVSMKTLIFIAVAFGALYALAQYLKADFTDALVPALVIYVGALAGVSLMNRKTKALKCQDCSNVWRQKINLTK